MNTELILKVADAIEAEAVDNLGFDMCSFGRPTYDEERNNCGTVACIVGWTCVIARDITVIETFRHLRHLVYEAGHVEEYHAIADNEARHLMDLTGYQADALFYGDGKPLSYITRAQAVAVLRHLAETGEVDWGKFESLGRA